jgi:hypothetical protein
MTMVPPQVFSAKKTFASTFFPEMTALLRRQAAGLAENRDSRGNMVEWGSGLL